VNTLAVITNTGSTRNLRGDNWIDPLLAGEANLIHFKISRAEDVAEAVQRAADAGAGTIIVNGGDGTADLVFAALFNGSAYSELPVVALLPAGKTNMTTAGWSLTGEPEAALKAVLRSRQEGTLEHNVVSRSVLRLSQGPNTPPLYGAFFGAADVVEGIHFCRKVIYPLKMPNMASHIASLAVLLWRGLRASPERGKVIVQEEGGIQEGGDFFAIGVSALDELLLGIKLVSGKAAPNKPLHYLSMRKGLRPIFGALMGFLRSRFAPGAGRTAKRVGQLTLRFTGAYTLDGELYEATSDQPLILNGDHRLNFLRITL
jgi:Diacylglycerol kinase catalytic domain